MTINYSNAQVFKHITIEDGLPSPNVYNIIQDSKGYLWIGTYTGGLCRYDGKTFETIANKDDYPSYQVRTISEEKDGSLLIGTSQGVYKYINRVYSKINLDTLKYQVTDFLRVSDNHLFIATTICVIEIKDSIKTYHAIDINSHIYPNSFSGFIKTNHGLYACARKGLFKYNEKSETFEKLIFENEGDFLARKGICINDTLIIATNKGLMYLHNDKIIKILNSTNSNLISDEVNYVYQSKFTNDLWVGAMGTLYKKINSNTFEIFNEKNGIDNFIINCIIEDAEGNLIFSSRNNGFYILIKNLFKNYGEKNKLIDKNIISIAQPNDSTIFLLSPSFIYKLNTNTNDISIITYYTSLGKEKFTTFAIDKYNNIWLSTIDNKLFKYSITNNVAQEIKPKKPLARINALTYDYQENLYVCTANGLETYKNNNFLPSFFPIGSSIIEDAIQLEDSATYFLTGSNIFSFKNNEATYLLKRIIYSSSISKDYKNNLWVQANDGLFQFDTKTKLLTPIQNKLNFSTIGFLATHCFQNYLIATSDDGLYVLNIKDYYEGKKIRYKHYTKNDGMLSSTIIAKKNLLDQNGTLWCGTSEGLIKFNFLSNNDVLFNPKLILNDIDLFYKPTNWKQIGFNEIDNIPTKLVLKHNQNNLTFKFVAIHLSNPEKIIYSILLKNSSKEVTLENTTGAVNFSDLLPGNYSLIIKAKLSNGNWSRNTLNYDFEILAPFYKTTWFYILVTVIIILSIISFIKYREKQIKEKNKRLEKVVVERTFLLKNANDELKVKSENLNKSYNELNIKSLQIKDSLEYSENLQKTILSLNSNFSSVLSQFAQFELLYQPKDNVSGDFYSAFEKDKKLYLVVADCTGHGVPGALMTILGYNILKQVIIDENLDDLEKIFFRVNQLFYNVFKSEAVSKNDGMALSVVSIDFELNTINCLGAQQSIIILDSNNVLNELKFHTTPINYPPQKSYFTQQSFHLSSIARIILFSDGITDQKGGPENKFLKKIGFKKWIIERNSQNNYYSEKIEDWMSTTKEQIDDILVLDITFS